MTRRNPPQPKRTFYAIVATSQTLRSNATWEKEVRTAVPTGHKAHWSVWPAELHGPHPGGFDQPILLGRVHPHAFLLWSRKCQDSRFTVHDACFFRLTQMSEADVVYARLAMSGVDTVRPYIFELQDADRFIELSEIVLAPTPLIHIEASLRFRDHRSETIIEKMLPAQEPTGPRVATAFERLVPAALRDDFQGALARIQREAGQHLAAAYAPLLQPYEDEFRDLIKWLA